MVVASESVTEERLTELEADLAAKYAKPDDRCCGHCCSISCGYIDDVRDLVAEVRRLQSVT